MSGISNQRKFRVTRWKQLFFPKELILDDCSVLTRKRNFPVFWIVKEESIPLRSVASIQISRGLLFSSLLIENSGGPFPIQIMGIPNRYVAEIRRIIEGYDPPEPVSEPEIDEPEELTKAPEVEKPESGKRPSFNPFKNLSLKKEMKKYIVFDDPIDDTSDSIDHDLLDSVDFDEAPIMVIDVRHQIEKDEKQSKSSFETIDEALDDYEKNKSASPGWMKEIISPPVSSSKK